MTDLLLLKELLKYKQCSVNRLSLEIGVTERSIYYSANKIRQAGYNVRVKSGVVILNANNLGDLCN